MTRSNGVYKYGIHLTPGTAVALAKSLLQRICPYDKPKAVEAESVKGGCRLLAIIPNGWVDPFCLDGGSRTMPWFAPFDGVVPPVSIPRDRRRRRGKSGRSCSPH